MTNEDNSRNRAALWGDYVGWDARKQGEDGFLIQELNRQGAHKVFDAALGDGVDTIALLEAGFDVSSNEADPYFRERAITRAAEHGIALEPTDHLWPNLGETYEANSFDAAICFGHSIGCVLGENDRIASLTAFHDLLKLGGSLIVDERNFRKMEDGIVLGQPFRPSGKYVYTGSGKIELRFVEQTEDRILGIEYRHTETDQTAYYRVRSFKEGELPENLQRAGFAVAAIKTYSDYREQTPPDPQADYYQYVATKQ